MIRYSGDAVVGAYIAKISNVTDPFKVEAKTAAKALEFAYDLGLTRIVLEGMH